MTSYRVAAVLLAIPVLLAACPEDPAADGDPTSDAAPGPDVVERPDAAADAGPVDGSPVDAGGDAAWPEADASTASRVDRVLARQLYSGRGLVAFGVDGSEPLLLPVEGRVESFVAAPPPTRWVAVTTTVVQGEAEAQAFYLVNVDGGEPRLLVAPDGETQVTSMAWSASGEWLAYARYAAGSAGVQIYLVRAAGGEPRLLDEPSSGKISWRPGTDELVVRRTDGTFDLVCPERDCTRSLTGGMSADLVDFAPVGDQVAFVHDTGTRRDIYVAEVGGEARKLSQQAEIFPYQLRWSPDATRLVFRASPDAFVNESNPLYLACVDGSCHQRVQFEGSMMNVAQWSPDGERIALVARVVVPGPPVSTKFQVHAMCIRSTDHVVTRPRSRAISVAHGAREPRGLGEASHPLAR